mgnify:CR=1 FL=1
MTEEITDEALDAAADEAPADNVLTADAIDEVVPEEGTDAPEEGTDEVLTEEIVEEGGEVAEEVPEEPDDHGERSQLGRKVGDNHRELTGQLEQMKRELDSFKQGVQSVQPPQPPEQLYNDDEEIPMTMGDLNKWYNNRVEHDRRQQNDDATRYESGYRDSFSELSRDLEPTEAKKIENEMLANFNERHSNDPTLDAERNFLRAENSLLRNKPPEKPQANLRQGKPTGGASGTTTAQRKAGAVKLDPIAAEFVNELKKSSGWSDEDVSKALEGETPSHLMGGKI